jgi:hypothetical protein
MGKKLKITEGQLQKLMERRHSYTDNSPEGDMEEGEMMGAPEDAIMDTEEEELSLEDQTIETLKKAHEFIMDQSEEGEENELCVEIMDLLKKLEPEEEEDQEMDDQNVEPSDEEDEMMNESIKSIKANFKRFL